MKIHIIGIAGVMTASLAQALVKQGHTVTGSDQEKIYPPISEIIKDIPLNQPLGKVDLVIVGSSFKSFKYCIDEFEKIKNLHIPYISATNYLAQNLIKKESILIAGSYGKTTISTMMSWLIPDANYFFGGIAVDNFPSLHFSDSNWSIIEADESINGLDTQAKFLYYPIKYLILTSAQWEHKESYPTKEDNFNAFKDLVSKIPTNGILVYNPHDSEIQKLLTFCRGKKIPYGNFNIKTKLIGEHNNENIKAVLTLCQELNINTDNLVNFSGIRRRLEILYNENNLMLIDDFGQSATRVLSALEAIRFSYPNRSIKVYFEPHASFLQNKLSINEFGAIYNHVNEFILAKIKYSANKINRVTVKDWQQVLKEKLIYLPIDTDIISHFKSSLKPNDILIHFSSGGLDGLQNLNRLVAQLNHK